PKHFITEPLRSFAPEKLENGDIRMAIAKAGQHAYSIFGDEVTLTEEFLSRDYKTWEGGLVSINHEHNHDWVKATIHDIEYDPENKLVVASFSGIPAWLMSLIYSPDFKGLSQECIPIEYRNDSADVIKGYGTGCTIVTDPYEPAANQGMGVGIPPALAAILSSKYPIEDTMTDKTGGGKPAVSVEAFESTVSENVQLKSQIKTMESQKTDLEKELVSWKQKYETLESGEADRIKIAVESAIKSYDTELKSKAEREEAVKELNSIMSKEAAESYMSTNPTVEQIRSITGIMKSNFSKGVGTVNSSNHDNGKSYEELNSAWNAKLGKV
ncbi:MAG: hypothetical protein WCU80_09425, partial [Paludibacteraceae bacterium]